MPNGVLKDIKFSRDIFEHKNIEKHKLKAKPGLNRKVVELISREKNEPLWLKEKRLKALEFFNKMPMPKWGPDLSKLDLREITFFAEPDAKRNARRWEDVPEDIKRTFERLGIPEAEQRYLAGVGAQYESTMVYHNLKKEWEAKGVIFIDMDEAVQKYPELVKKYFMTKCVPINDHKFTALHAAVWSSGSFVYIPKNVKVEIPLQAYFRMNSEKMGQFEHTLIIVDEGAEVSYIEGCFTKGTLITTNPNLKPIEEIKEGDKVLTHKGRYKTVYFTQVRNYSGRLYNIQIYGDSSLILETTAEHPFLCVKKLRNRERNKTFKIEWKRAKDLTKDYYLVMPINKVVESFDYKEFEIEKNRKKIILKVKNNENFFKLIGYYLAEGSISNGHYLNFSFGEHEKDKIKEVEQLLPIVFGVKTLRTYHKKNHGIDVVVCDTKLARLFGKEFGMGAKNKSLPRWVMLESEGKQKALIYGWFKGDGNYYNQRPTAALKEVFRINTISGKLARQGKEILLRLGIVPFLNKKDRKKEGREIMWTLGITGEYMLRFGDIVGIKIRSKLNGTKRYSRFFIDNRYAYVPIRNIKSRFAIAEPVYNFGVDSDETYVANNVVVHNCSSPRYIENSLHAGCVEIYVHKNARARYSSVENWSKNTFNLNTKRAIVDENGVIEWVNSNMGSSLTMLYPSSILKGENAKSNYLGIAFAGNKQHQDTGTKVYHLAKNTTSIIRAKSISKDGGITCYRGLVKIAKGALNARSSVKCDALILDDKSKSDTIPLIDIKENKADIVHEATVGKISAEQLFYLMTRGLNEEQAMQLIVSGFIEPVVKELPLEYAVELNRLIQLEIESSIG